MPTLRLVKKSEQLEDICHATSKFKHETQRGAYRAMKEAHGTKFMSAYKCKFCKFWHYGHTPKNQKFRTC